MSGPDPERKRKRDVIDEWNEYKLYTDELERKVIDHFCYDNYEKRIYEDYVIERPYEKYDVITDYVSYYVQRGFSRPKQIVVSDWNCKNQSMEFVEIKEYFHKCLPCFKCSNGTTYVYHECLSNQTNWNLNRDCFQTIDQMQCLYHHARYGPCIHRESKLNWHTHRYFMKQIWSTDSYFILQNEKSTKYYITWIPEEVLLDVLLLLKRMIKKRYVIKSLDDDDDDDHYDAENCSDCENDLCGQLRSDDAFEENTEDECEESEQEDSNAEDEQDIVDENDDE